MKIFSLLFVVILYTSGQEIERTASALLAAMTLEEKVGQMIQAERAELEPGDIAKYNLGSVLSGGGSVPEDAPGDQPPDSWAKLLNSYLEETSTTRLRIPIIYGMDAVHGVNNVVGATIFPHNINYGATAVGDEVIGIVNIQEEGKAVQEEVHALGGPWTFGPVLGNPQNIHWGRTYEGFSENISIPTILGPEFIKAVQSTGEVAACMKHYIGEGYTTNGINRGDAVLTEEEVRSILSPYIESVKAGAWTLMPSFSSINGVKCTENKLILQTILKDELGFDGFTISDWDAVALLQGGTYKEKIARCVNAGLDMIMATVDGDDPHEPQPRLHWIETYQLLLENVNEGLVNLSRIDDAVLRILTIKQRLGLLNSTIEKIKPGKIGTHRDIARRHVSDSLVLLRNENQILAKLQSFKRFLVAGQGADDIGMQCGGWTRSWQGDHGDIVPGTSILDGLRTVAASKEFVYSEDASTTLPAGSVDAAIVVIGEDPYAEWFGDTTGNITLRARDVVTLQNAYKLNVPVIVILLSGRPLHLGDEVEKWDALIAAFLPGSEAGLGIADVLFGPREFVAKTPYTWLKYDGGDPLYPYGTGLTKTPAGDPCVWKCENLDAGCAPSCNINFEGCVCSCNTEGCTYNVDPKK